MQMAVNRELSAVIVENRDRLSRFGFELIEQVLESLGTKVIVISNAENKSYEKELTDDELAEEIKDIQGERPISYAYMEISGTITYQGLIRSGIVPVTGGKMWYAWDEDNGISRYFQTKKECGDFIKANFKGEYRKACLMLLAHATGRAKVNL